MKSPLEMVDYWISTATKQEQLNDVAFRTSMSISKVLRCSAVFKVLFAYCFCVCGIISSWNLSRGFQFKIKQAKTIDAKNTSTFFFKERFNNSNCLQIIYFCKGRIFDWLSEYQRKQTNIKQSRWIFLLVGRGFILNSGSFFLLINLVVK